MASTMNIWRVSLRRTAAWREVSRPRIAPATSQQAASAIFSSTPSSPSPFSAVSPFSTSAACRTPSSVDAPSQGATASEAAPAAPAETTPVSSCPEGTVLSGLSYMKGKTDPVALADDAYPSWLWRCLEVVQKKDAAAEDAEAGDEFSKSKKQRRLALKRRRELEAQVMATGDVASLAPKIPLQHQSVNLPGVGVDAANDLEGVLEAAAARKDLRKALRRERLAKIKERNYLQSM